MASSHEIIDFKVGERVLYEIQSSGRRLGAVVKRIGRERVIIYVDGDSHPRGVMAHHLYKNGEV